MVESGVLEPQRLVGRRIPLEDTAEALVGMDQFPGIGVTVVDRFQ